MEPKTKEIEIEWNGRPEKVVFKKLNYKEKMDILEAAVTVRLMGEIPDVQVNWRRAQDLAFIKSLIKAPFTIDINVIGELEPEVVENMIAEASKFNNLDLKKNISMAGQQFTDPMIQP